MPIRTAGRFVGPEGAPVEGRSIVLQTLTAKGWLTVEEIRGSSFDLELPDPLPGSGRGRTGAPPLRLLDQSPQTPLVLAAAPMWQVRDDPVLADFGSIRLLPEPYLRAGLGLKGEWVIGVPLELPATDEDGAEVEELRRRLQATRSDLEASEAALGKSRAELESREAQLEASRAALETSRADLETSRAQLETSRAALANSQADLEASEAEVHDVRLELSEALTRVDELTSTLGTPTGVVDVISGLGTQLSLTNTALATQPTPFRLTEVQLDLRGRLGEDGSTIVMDGTADGSGIRADLVVDAPSTTVPNQGVPSVLGLTPSAAARVLRSVGFPMDSATQQLGDGQGVPGQALAQEPAPGTDAEHGTRVLVVFGTRSESDE